MIRFLILNALVSRFNAVIASKIQQKELHNLPSSEVLAGRWSATKSAPRGAGANPDRKQLWGGGLFVSNSAASQRTRELQSFTAKAEKRGGKKERGREGERLPPGKEKSVENQKRKHFVSGRRE